MKKVLIEREKSDARIDSSERKEARPKVKIILLIVLAYFAVLFKLSLRRHAPGTAPVGTARAASSAYSSTVLSSTATVAPVLFHQLLPCLSVGQYLVR